MAGKRGVDGDGAGFQIANFPDHHDVRRLTENRAQRPRKREAHDFIHLHLVDAGQNIFHRVFHRDDFAVGSVDEIQTRIERRCLAGTRRAGHEQNSVRHRNHALERLLVVRQKSQLRQTELQSVLVQNTHDDALAVVRRQTRHAQINQLAPDLRLDTSVLRDAMFRDDHARRNFQTRNDRRLQLLRRRLHFLQHAVNAVAQAKFFPQRFQVNVRRAQLERVHDDLVHQPDERRVHLRHPALRLHHLDVAQGQFFNDLLERRVLRHGLLLVAAVIFSQRRLDVRLRRHAQFDVRVQQVMQRVQRVQVGGIGDGHRHFRIGFENGNDAIFFGDVARNHRDDIVFNLERRKVHDFRTKLRGLGLRHVAGTDGLVRHEIIHHAHTGGHGLVARPRHDVGAGETKVHQQVQ